MADSEKKSTEKVFQNDEWSQERQIQEVARRWDFYSEVENQEISFKPLPDNIIVAAPPKCGTTWLLHICHQIRMHGAEPDFEYQTNITTWLELAEKAFNLDPATMPQPASPRLLATHLQYPLVPKGGRIIYCFREQKDMIVSAYYYLDTFFSLKGRVSLPNFCLAVMQQVEKHRENNHQRRYRICAVFATKTVKRRRTLLTCTAPSMPRIETIIYGPQRRHRQSIRVSPSMYVFFPVLRRDFTVFREGTVTFTVI